MLKTLSETSDNKICSKRSEIIKAKKTRCL